MTSPQRAIVKEVLLTYGGVFLAIVASTLLRPLVGDESALLVAVAFLLGALRRATQHGFARFGLSLGGLLGPLPPADGETEPSASPPSEAEPSEPEHSEPWLAHPEPFSLVLRRGLPSALREIGVSLAAMALVFPPFFVAFLFWNDVELAEFHWDVPLSFVSTLAAQLVVVALPEEAFFRGYIQTRLSDAFDPSGEARTLGAPVSSRVLVLQAALFALVHLGSNPHPARLATFFPGLLFGWLRARRGGIGASTLLHAASNGLSALLYDGFRL